MESKLTTIFCGNPGSGKSTMLNSFLGVVKFQAGVSIGKGLTKIIQTETDAYGNQWADTPGLNDTKMRKEAAAEISKGLKLGGLYRMIFVILLDAGRLRPEDKVTMSLIIDAAKLKTSEYGIIVNKIPEKTIIQIEKNSEQKTELFTLLNDALPGTQFIYLNPKNNDLEDEKNALVPPSDEILRFLSKIPPVGIDPATVADIKPENFEISLLSMTEQMEAMRNNNRLLQEKYEKILEQLKNTRRSGDSEQDLFATGLKTMEKMGNQITPESSRSYSNCPECNKRIYVLKGAPYDGACIDCLNSKNFTERAVSVISGILKSWR